MKHFKLRDSFLTGHRQIDAEHAQLVMLLNACIDISNENGDRAKFCAKFSEFENTIYKHIKNEEAIMIELGYFDTDADAAAHIRGAQVFRDLTQDCQLNIGMDTILKQATNALLELILKTDLGIKAYLHKIGYQEP